MAHQHSAFWGLAALGLVVVTGLPGSASASEPRQTHAGLRQNSTATAISIGNDAFASATNRSRTAPGSSTFARRSGSGLTTDRKPEVDTAVAAAVSVGGRSKAVASNNGPVLSDNAGPGTTRPLDLLESRRTPSTSSAVSVAVTIDGVPIHDRR
jgi:hypothetical protein